MEGNMTHEYVKRECVKAYLGEVRRRANEIAQLELEIGEMRARLDGMAAHGGGDGGKRKPDDRMAREIARIEQRESELRILHRSDDEFIARAEALCLPRYKNRWICWLHWAKGEKWVNVARRIGYSRQTAHRLANDGIDELYPLIPEEFRRYTFPPAAPSWDGDEE